MPGDVSASDDSVARPPAPRRSTPPVASLRPVDIHPIGAFPAPGEVGNTDRRERLQRIVVGTLGGCGLILIAAAGAQVARASASTGSSQPVAVLTRAADPTAAVQPAPPPAPAAAPDPAPVVEAPSIGTIRLHWPAVPGHVWLDGEKIASSSTVVACGKHELRVGAKGRAHDIDVPCGGEFRITR